MLLLECRSGPLLDSRCISAHPFVVWLCALRPLHCAWLLGCVAKVANVTILRIWRLRGIPTPGAFPSCPPSRANSVKSSLPCLSAESGHSLSIASHVPFGHERPSVLGRAPVSLLHLYLVAPEQRPGSPGTVSCFPGARLDSVSWTSVYAALPPPCCVFGLAAR
jgi:hypothetical protein